MAEKAHSINGGRPVPITSILGRGMGRFDQTQGAELVWDFSGKPDEDSYMRPPDLGLPTLRPLPWTDQASCKLNPGPWMARPGEGQGEAIRICLTICPVYDECLEWSETDEAKATEMVVAGKQPLLRGSTATDIN